MRQNTEKFPIVCPLTEIARRLGTHVATVDRKLDAAGIKPTAIFVAGRRNIPVYDYHRFKEIAALFPPEECTLKAEWQQIAEDEASTLL